MKLKINKACDLNSISVLPPHTRRSSMIAQPPLQPSQQSFSQGFSSQQNGMFSQLSQNSFDDTTITENQRFGSQEKDSLVKRVSSLAPISYPREESQMPISRSSSNLTRRWSSATGPDHKCQLNDEMEHRIAMMETSLSRFGMILDSVQADVMQVNKGTKELLLAVEGIRQKSIAHNDSLHLVNRGQEDIRTSLDVDFKALNDQLSKITQQDKLDQILAQIFNLPEQIDTTVQKRNGELSESLSGDLQAITCCLKSLNQTDTALAILPPKVTGADSSTQSFLGREAEPRKMSKLAPFAPKIETGSWTTVKSEQVTLLSRHRSSCKNLKQNRACPLDMKQKTVIQLDEQSDEDLSCFIVEKEFDSHLMDEVNEETARILRLARRRKRKQNSKRSIPTYQKSEGHRRKEVFLQLKAP